MPKRKRTPLLKVSDHDQRLIAIIERRLRAKKVPIGARRRIAEVLEEISVDIRCAGYDEGIRDLLIVSMDEIRKNRARSY